MEGVFFFSFYHMSALHIFFLILGFVSFPLAFTVLGLHCRMPAFSGCSKQGPFFTAELWLLTALASHLGAQTLQRELSGCVTQA